MSGWLTISRSGVPARFRSMRLSALPATSSCMLLPASSSRWARMMPIRFGSNRALGIADLQPAVVAQRQVVLADLVALGQVGIVVVLAVPLGEAGDLAVQGQGRLDATARPRGGSSPAACPACRCTPGRSACWAGAELRAARAEHLALGEQLHVDFQADDDGVGLGHGEGIGDLGI